jgi:hypothetical protein
MQLGGRPDKPWFRRLIGLVFTAAGIVLFYFDVRGGYSDAWSQIATFTYLAAWLIVFNLPRVRTALGYPPRVGAVSESIGDFLIFSACVIGGIFATLFALKVLPNTAFSAVILITLILGVACLSAFFVGRILFRLTRR